MKFRNPSQLVDPSIGQHLARAEVQIDELHRIEEAFLTLRAARDTKWSILYLQAPPGTVDHKKAWVNGHNDWFNFSRTLAEAEAKFHREKHKFDVVMKYVDASYLTLKIEKMSIERGVGG